jgi:hypothetical protein
VHGPFQLEAAGFDQELDVSERRVLVGEDVLIHQVRETARREREFARVDADDERAWVVEDGRHAGLGAEERAIQLADLDDEPVIHMQVDVTKRRGDRRHCRGLFHRRRREILGGRWRCRLAGARDSGGTDRHEEQYPCICVLSVLTGTHDGLPDVTMGPLLRNSLISIADGSVQKGTGQTGSRRVGLQP